MSFDLLLQVLSPLSDSILAEKTVTVLDDKVKQHCYVLACITTVCSDIPWCRSLVVQNDSTEGLSLKIK